MVIKSLNNMFHRHGRWLFAIFTVIIIVSFLGFLTPGQFGLDGIFGGGGAAVGTIYGEKVSIDELQQARRELQIYYLCMTGREISVEPVQAFQVLAFIRMASRRGIAVSDADLRDAVQKAACFCNPQGKFDLETYKKVIGNLKKQGITEADVETAFRQQLMIRKLEESVVANTIVTPGEARTFYNRNFAAYTVLAAKFNAAKDSVKPTDAELKKYFEGARQAYQIEAKASGIIVEFPYANFTAAAKADAAKPGVLEAFYKNNAARFVDDKGKLVEFSKIKEKALEAYLKVATEHLALRAASDFAIAADEVVMEAEAPKRLDAFKGKLKDLKAGTGKAVIFPVSDVSESATVISGRQIPGFAKKLVAVGRTTRPITECVAGQQGICVGYCIKVTPARPAELAEVEAKVRTDYAAVAGAKAAREAAEKALAALEKLPADQRVKAIRGLKNAVVTGFTFSMTQLPPSGEEMAAMAAMELSNGQLSSVLPTPDGAMFVFVEKKVLPDPKKFQEYEVSCLEFCRRTKAQLAMQQLYQELGANCRWNMDKAQQAAE